MHTVHKSAMSCTGYNCAIAGEVLIAPVLLLLHYRAAMFSCPFLAWLACEALGPAQSLSLARPPRPCDIYLTATQSMLGVSLLMQHLQVTATSPDMVLLMMLSLLQGAVLADVILLLILVYAELTTAALSSVSFPSEGAACTEDTQPR